MTLQLIVNAILTILLPVMIGAVYLWSRALVQRLPEYQRGALAQFARMAAQYVEWEHKEALNKTELAMACCENLFDLFKLRRPSQLVIEIAVKSALFEAGKLAAPSE